jgi:hypothetical protein
MVGAVLLALGAFAIVNALTSSPSPSAGSNTYGGLPSWLPKSTVPVGRTLQASPSHPVLGIEGDTVHVRISTGGADIVAVGPQVPESGGFPVPTTSPVSFSVTIDQVRGTIPISPSDFVILDELGHLHHPSVTMANGAVLPHTLAGGHRFDLVINDDAIPTGSGDLQWKPIAGRPLVSWDFDVEID